MRLSVPKSKPLSDHYREKYETVLKQYEPYTDEELVELGWDNPKIDSNRLDATIAKKRLNGEI